MGRIVGGFERYLTSAVHNLASSLLWRRASKPLKFASRADDFRAATLLLTPTWTLRKSAGT
jgi:hypothetical protein